MKKYLLAVFTALLCVGVLVGCGDSGQSKATSASGSEASYETTNGKISIVCANYPAYDWCRAVVGDKAAAFDITYLMEGGVDLHSYQPTVDDMAKIADADLFVFVGGESDEWARDAVEATGSSSLRSISMLDIVGDAAVAEEVVEGMQAEEHEHEENAEEAQHDEEELEYDEHVWLSLRNAQKLVDAIAAELCSIDASNAATYTANADEYKAKLKDLDNRYAAAVKAGKANTLVFADRFPFRYLTEDYDLSYYAAFVGCSAETEASFETVAFLANKVDELGLSKVLVIESSDKKIAQTVIQNTRSKDQKILVMDSLQSMTADEMKAGKSYLSAMEDNLVVLSSALE